MTAGWTNMIAGLSVIISGTALYLSICVKLGDRKRSERMIEIEEENYEIQKRMAELEEERKTDSKRAYLTPEYVHKESKIYICNKTHNQARSVKGKFICFEEGSILSNIHYDEYIIGPESKIEFFLSVPEDTADPILIIEWKDDTSIPGIWEGLISIPRGE